MMELATYVLRDRVRTRGVGGRGKGWMGVSTRYIYAKPPNVQYRPRVHLICI